MGFDITSLTVFLLAVMPGFVAQQSRHSLVPRPLEPKTALEETGEYVLNSLFVHLFSLLVFRECLLIFHPQLILSLGEAIVNHDFVAWAYNHRYLSVAYLCSSIVAGFILGLFRGYLALIQPVRNNLAGYVWFRQILKGLRIPSFIEEGPVWYDVLKEQGEPGRFTFVQIRMKSGCFYTGELQRYGVLKDSEKNKDLYLVNAYFRGSAGEQYQRLECKGVLLNFGDMEAVEVLKHDAGATSP